MLRALLVGLLAVVAILSCSGSSDTKEVAPNASAGRVLDVSGSVAATRDGKTRTLAVGGDVFRDDMIETPADGSVAIELFHNNARWSVEGGQKSRVDQSVAWGLAKQDKPAKVVDHATSAAGRDGERTAADTRATSDRGAEPAAAAPDQLKQPEAAPPPGAGEAAPARAAPPPPARRHRGKAAARADEDEAGGGAPPPPPPPPAAKAARGGAGDAISGAPMPAPRAAAIEVPSGGGGAARDPALAPKEKAAPKPGPSGEEAKNSEAAASSDAPVLAVADPVRSLVEGQRAAIATCLGASATLTVKVAKGKPTFQLAGIKATAKQRACVAAALKKIKFPAADAQVSIDVVK